MNCILKVMLGLFLSVLDGKVQINIWYLNILTDILGYGLIIWGVHEMIPWSPCFKKSRTHAVWAAVCSIGLRFALNFSVSYSIQSLLRGMGTIFFIYLTYYMMEGYVVKNKMDKIEEPTGNLKGAWIALAVSNALYCFCYLADLKELMLELGLEGLEQTVIGLMGVAVFATDVFFIMVMNQERSLIFPREDSEEK